MRLSAMVTVTLLLVVLAAAPAPGARAVAPAAPPAPTATAADCAALVAGALADLAGEDLGKRSAAQKALEAAVHNTGRPGAEVERAAMSRALAAKIAGGDAGARVWLIRMLQHVGGAEAVPALVALLDDKDALVRESARRAVQMNSSPEAGAALRAALDKTADPAWRVAMINAVAARKDRAAVASVAKGLADKDESVALAAAAGLGKIGGPESAAALAAARAAASPKVQNALIDSCLLCADQFVAEGRNDAAITIYEDLYKGTNPDRVRLAALRGLLIARGGEGVAMLGQILTGPDEKLKALAFPFVQEMTGPGATKALADLAPRLAPPMQAALVTELGSRGDAAAKPAVLAAARSPDAAVRLAAVKALAGLGDATDIAFLAKTAAGDGDDRDAARTSLDRLPAKDIDAAMVGAVASADAKVRVELVRSLAARRAAAALPVFTKFAEHEDAALRAEAVKGIEAVGDEKTAGLLISLIGKAPTDQDRQAAEKALGAVCGRAPAKDAVLAAVTQAIAGAAGPGKASLLRTLAPIGGPKALEPVRAALKDADAAVRDAALRTLADWPDDSALQDLIDLARTEDKVGSQVLVLRGFVRLAAASSAKEPEKVVMYQRALAAARRPEDKRMVLGPLGELGSLAALQLAAPLMQENAAREEAAAASAKIAKRMGGRLPDEVRTAMETVLQVSKNNRTRKDAEDVLKKFAGQPKK